NHHLAGRFEGQIPLVLKDLIGEGTYFVRGSFARSQEPLFQGQRMLRLFIAPVGLEPGPAAALADEVQDLRGVIRQEKLNGAERFDNQGDVVRDRRIAIPPGNIFLDVPPALRLRAVKELFIEVKKPVFKLYVTHKMAPPTRIELVPQP